MSKYYSVQNSCDSVRKVLDSMLGFLWCLIVCLNCCVYGSFLASILLLLLSFYYFTVLVTVAITTVIIIIVIK